MWRFVISMMIFVSFPISVFPWWETVVDTVEIRYPNGQLKESYQTVFWGGNESTSKTGFYRSWYENGQLEWDGQYAADLKVHTWIKWDSTGRRAEEISYLTGEKHGSEIEWNPNGTIRKELHYRNDTLHGLCTWRKDNYNINGLANNPNLTIQVQSFYVDGKLLVPITGETDKLGGYPCNDLLSPYYNADLDLWVDWHTRPCEFFVGRKVDGKKQGAWVLWTQSGNMKKVEFYDKDSLLISE
jgi:hypothetical protein